MVTLSFLPVLLLALDPFEDAGSVWNSRRAPVPQVMEADPQGLDWHAAGGSLFTAGPLTNDPGPSAGVVPPSGSRNPAPDDPFGVDTLDSPPGPARLDALSQPFMAAIGEAADRHGLDPKLLHALVIVESGYRSTACSPAGACGLAQLMPATATELGVHDRFDPTANLRGGADYLARQILRFGDLRLALAAYNSGPARVARLGRIPDIPETQAYVTAVVDCYLALSAGRRMRSAGECRRPGGGS